MPSSSSRRPFPFFPGARTPPSNTQDPPYDPLEHECTPIPIFHPPHSLEKEVKEQAKQDEEDEQAGRASLERSLSTLKNPAWCAELRREIATPDHPDWNVMYYENLKRIQEMVQDVWEKKYSFRRIINFKMNFTLDGSPQDVKNVKQLVEHLNLKTPIKGRGLILLSLLTRIENLVGGPRGSTRYEIVKDWSESIAWVLEALHRNKVDSEENWIKLIVVIKLIADNRLGITDRTLFFNGDEVAPILSAHNLVVQMQLQAPHNLVCPKIVKTARKRRNVGPAFVATARFVKETARPLAGQLGMIDLSGF
ncbi:hypothetical protein JCM5353_006272 [Sporobolomyces roseus]